MSAAQFATAPDPRFYRYAARPDGGYEAREFTDPAEVPPEFCHLSPMAAKAAAVTLKAEAEAAAVQAVADAHANRAVDIAGLSEAGLCRLLHAVMVEVEQRGLVDAGRSLLASGLWGKEVAVPGLPAPQGGASEEQRQRDLQALADRGFQPDVAAGLLAQEPEYRQQGLNKRRSGDPRVAYDIRHDTYRPVFQRLSDEELGKVAARLGVKVDGRWKRERLAGEVAAAYRANDPGFRAPGQVIGWLAGEI